MADPITLGIGATALGGVVGAGGKLLEGYGQQQADIFKATEATYQAGIAQQNQEIAQQNANYALYSGEVQAQQAGMKLRSEIATTKAEQGASNLDVNSGSAVLVRSAEQEVGQENISLIRSDAAKRAYGYTVQSWQYGTQATWDQTAATFDKGAAQMAMISGEISAAGSLLGGASSVGSQWMAAKSSGALKG
jgi:hypothetical protein